MGRDHGAAAEALASTRLIVPGIRCAACIASIEAGAPLSPSGADGLAALALADAAVPQPMCGVVTFELWKTSASAADGRE